MAFTNPETLSGGQIIFTPSRNPFEILPGFIKAWAIVGTVFAGIWCAAALVWWTAGIVMLAYDYPAGDAMIIFMQGAAAALVGGIGLSANILLLSRKPRGVSMGRCLIVLTILHILWDLVQGVLLFLCWNPDLQMVLGISIGAVTLTRITLLVFYWIAIVRAARYFETRRQCIGF